MGSPSRVNPQGTDAAGCPVRLKGIGVREPSVRRHGLARDRARMVEAECERRARDGRRQQQIVALEERARVLPPGEPVEPRLHVPARRARGGRADDRVKAGLDVVLAVLVREEPGRQPPAEDVNQHSPGDGQRGATTSTRHPSSRNARAARAAACRTSGSTAVRFPRSSAYATRNPLTPPRIART